MHIRCGGAGCQRQPASNREQAMDDKLDTRRARYFMQVIDSGSVRGAAEVLGMDASAVSRAIGALDGGLDSLRVVVSSSVQTARYEPNSETSAMWDSAERRVFGTD